MEINSLQEKKDKNEVKQLSTFIYKIWNVKL